MKPLAVGIVGGGNISDTHARAVSEVAGLQVAAVTGSNIERVGALAARYGAAVLPDVEALVRHRPLDLVLLGSPSGLHAQQGIAAARQGLHVLTEKPVDVSVERADELIAECECDHGCPTCVGPIGETGPRAKTVALALLQALLAGQLPAGEAVPF